ncbi:MAG: hypothetical protein QF733_08300 [Phycisphaerales bacterium]|nr:hypothetical protein [Phycisphaerales bacterium]
MASRTPNQIRCFYHTCLTKCDSKVMLAVFPRWMNVVGGGDSHLNRRIDSDSWGGIGGCTPRVGYA